MTISLQKIAFRSRQKTSKTTLTKQPSTAFSFSRSPRMHALSVPRADDRPTAAAAAAAAKVFFRPLAGNEHPPGMPPPSLPFLLYQTQHPNPNLS
jgi:hypothetical protein